MTHRRPGQGQGARKEATVGDGSGVGMETGGTVMYALYAWAEGSWVFYRETDSFSEAKTWAELFGEVIGW